MTDFDALLKRSFAEAPEPADDGFSIAVSRSVARRESANQTRGYVVGLGWAAAGSALVYGAYVALGLLGVDFVSVAGDQIGAVRASIGEATPSANGFAQSTVQSLSASMTYILLSAAALAGGAVAYRSAQD